MYGELIPLGGGDPIPLLKQQMLVGRRESCDIILAICQRLGTSLPVVDRERLPVRPRHAEPQRHQGQRRPGERSAARSRATRFAIAKHRYRVEYDPAELGAVGPPPPDNLSQEIMQRIAPVAGGARFSRGRRARNRAALPAATTRPTIRPARSSCPTRRCEEVEVESRGSRAGGWRPPGGAVKRVHYFAHRQFS